MPGLAASARRPGGSIRRADSRLLALVVLGLVTLAPAGRGLVQASRGQAPLGGAGLAALQVGVAEELPLLLPRRAEVPLDVVVRVDGQDRTLRLRPHSIRTPGFTLRVQDGSGAWRVRTPSPPSTVRGEVLGLPGSMVAGSLEDGHLRVLVRLGASGEVWGIQPLPGGESEGVAPGDPVGVAPTAPSPGAGELGGAPVVSSHAVFRAADVVSPAGVCLAVPSADPGFALGPDPGGEAAEGSAPKVCEIACVADVEFFVANGSSISATEADMEAIVNGCEAIYFAQTDISYQISSMLVHTAEADPYASTDPSALLQEFRGEWNAENGAIPRDIAHLFTGKNLDGSVIGVAYVGVICSGSYGYGLSQSRFSSNYAARVALTAHEVGHNWGAGHCNGDADCNIMCSGLGGCAGGLEVFGAASVATIEATRDGAGCLAEGLPGGGPTITSVDPPFGPEGAGHEVVLVGEDFVDDPGNRVLFGGVEGEIVSMTGDTAVVLPPPGLAGQAVDLVLTGVGGTAVLTQAYTYEWLAQPGDSAEGTVTAGDIDRLFLELAAGTLLTVKLKAKASQVTGMVPGLRLLDAAGDDVALVEDDPADPAGVVKLKRWPLEATDVYRLEVYGLDDTTGDYELKLSTRPVKTIKQVVSVGPGTPEVLVTFGATPGTSVRSLKLKALAAKGAYKTIEALPSALQPQVLGLEGPAGEVDLGTPLVTDKRVKLQWLPLDAFGEYQLRLGGAEASVGHGKLHLRLKPPPKDKQKLVEAPASD